VIRFVSGHTIYLGRNPQTRCCACIVPTCRGDELGRQLAEKAKEFFTESPPLKLTAPFAQNNPPGAFFPGRDDPHYPGVQHVDRVHIGTAVSGYAKTSKLNFSTLSATPKRSMRKKKGKAHPFPLPFLASTAISDVISGVKRRFSGKSLSPQAAPRHAHASASNPGPWKQYPNYRLRHISSKQHEYICAAARQAAHEAS